MTNFIEADVEQAALAAQRDVLLPRVMSREVGIKTTGANLK